MDSNMPELDRKALKEAMTLTQAEIDAIVKDANLYHSLRQVALANGFESITEAIAKGARAEAAEQRGRRLREVVTKAIETDIAWLEKVAKTSGCRYTRIGAESRLDTMRPALAALSEEEA